MSVPTEHRVVVERHVPCEMRDGVTLRADVYRPDDDRPVPALVHRIPYNRQNPMTVTNSMFPPIVAADRGYAVVVQDTRGRFGSEGDFDPFRQEVADGYDTVEWAASQPWCNGRVGIYGSSYMGVTALQAVAAEPPHLETAIAYLTGGDYHNGWVYTGGAFEWLFNLRWAAGPAASELRRAGLSPGEENEIRERLRWIVHHPEDALGFTPISEVFGPATTTIPFWDEWLSRPDRDEYWESIDLTETLAGAAIPVLNVTGWYDPFLIGQLNVWETLSGQAGNPGHELMIGPWDHQAYQGVRNNAAGDRFFGPRAVGGAAGLAGTFLDWFDSHLREDGTGGQPSAPVRYFHMGPDEWVDAARWPPVEAGTTTLYLGSSGGANTRLGDGVLLAGPAGDLSVDSYVYDPHDPVPTCGGRHLGFRYGPAGVRDQAGLELRDDVLVYTGPRLTSALDVVGFVGAELWVTSSAPSTDFTAKLVDVRPDGYCANVAEGIIRVPAGRHLDSGPIAVSIDMWATAFRFEPGHRVRLEVSSSNFPRFDRNGNTGANPPHTVSSDWVDATQQVWSDAGHPSRLIMGGSSPS